MYFINNLFFLKSYLTDIDECRGGASCDVQANCTNLEGGYSCSCKQGFDGNGTYCHGTFIYLNMCFLSHLLHINI